MRRGQLNDNLEKVCACSVTQLCLTLCNTMDCSVLESNPNAQLGKNLACCKTGMTRQTVVIQRVKVVKDGVTEINQTTSGAL